MVRLIGLLGGIGDGSNAKPGARRSEKVLILREFIVLS
jgi:hypothetical protein